MRDQGTAADLTRPAVRPRVGTSVRPLTAERACTSATRGTSTFTRCTLPATTPNQRRAFHFLRAPTQRCLPEHLQQPVPLPSGATAPHSARTPPQSLTRALGARPPLPRAPRGATRGSPRAARPARCPPRRPPRRPPPRRPPSATGPRARTRRHPRPRPRLRQHAVTHRTGSREPRRHAPPRGSSGSTNSRTSSFAAAAAASSRSAGATRSSPRTMRAAAPRPASPAAASDGST